MVEVMVPKPLQKKALYELFLFSTFTFVCIALLLQFLITFQTAILLKHYSISFTYRLFGIGFSPVSAYKWPEARIFIVYGLGMLAFFGAGILLLFLLEKIKHIQWKIRLVLTWIAFFAVHTLPMWMLAGMFFFEGFGIAYQWLFENIYVRVILSLLALMVVVYFRSFWMNMFLKNVYSISFLSGSKNRQTFIKSCFIFPWLAGLIILLPFVWLHHAWSWLVYLVGLGLVLLPIFGNKTPHRKFMIYKAGNKIFSFRFPLPLFLLVVTILWVADYLSKTNF